MVEQTQAGVTTIDGTPGPDTAGQRYVIDPSHRITHQTDGRRCLECTEGWRAAPHDESAGYLAGEQTRADLKTAAEWLRLAALGVGHDRIRDIVARIEGAVILASAVKIRLEGGNRW